VTEAAGIYRQWLEHDPDNPIARHMTTAATGLGSVPERASNEYVAELYNGFAETFDRRLADLQYKAHEILSSLLVSEIQKRHELARVLDAGCGTGLCGLLLRPISRRLVGVDLSTGMISKARERQVYDELVVGELCAFMSDHAGAFDAVILADTLIYFGDLSLAFRAACLSLTPGGLLAFAVECLDVNEPGPGYRLELHGRYTHRESYTEQSLRETGFSLLTMDRIVIRRECDADVHGLAVLARKEP
jgi:predicted TPR repeat methyltransferase